MMTVPTERSKIIRSDFAPNAWGDFGRSSTLSAKPGDVIELGLSDIVGIGKLADLDISVRGDSVRLDAVRDLVRVDGGHILLGKFELDAVLLADRPGRSIGDIVVIAPDGSTSGIVALVVEVD